MSWKEIIEGKIDTKMSDALQKKQEVVSERTVEEENAYQEFFQKALKKFGVESPAERKGWGYWSSGFYQAFKEKGFGC